MTTPTAALKLCRDALMKLAECPRSDDPQMPPNLVRQIASQALNATRATEPALDTERERRCSLTAEQLADPEFVRAYIEGQNESFDTMMEALKQARAALDKAGDDDHVNDAVEKVSQSSADDRTFMRDDSPLKTDEHGNRYVERLHGWSPNFCPRCGKRAFDGIHTCTPPGEASADTLPPLARGYTSIDAFGGVGGNFVRLHYASEEAAVQAARAIRDRVEASADDARDGMAALVQGYIGMVGTTGDDTTIKLRYATSEDMERAADAIMDGIDQAIAALQRKEG